MVLNPSLSPELKMKLTGMAEKKRFKVVSLDDAPPMLRGAVYEELLAERYLSIRWNFRWENYVVVGVPDGITDDFVYEFKTTGSRFLLGHIERSALAQEIFMGTFLGARISGFRFILWMRRKLLRGMRELMKRRL